MESAKHAESVEKALTQADLSIHLFDRWPGRKIVNQKTTTYPRMQWEIALSSAVRKLVWIPADLRFTNGHDESQRDFLNNLSNEDRSAGQYEIVRVAQNNFLNVVYDIIAQIQLLTVERRPKQEQDGKLRDEEQRKEAEIGKIFISYSRNDQTYARKLTDYLENGGLSVWTDDRIDYGEDWWDAIEENIINCGAMVLIMTPNSKKTKWVKREMMFADNLNKPIFPLLLEGDCFPFFISHHHHDVRDKSMPPKSFITKLMRLGRQRG